MQAAVHSPPKELEEYASSALEVAPARDAEQGACALNQAKGDGPAPISEHAGGDLALFLAPAAVVSEPLAEAYDSLVETTAAQGIGSPHVGQKRPADDGQSVASDPSASAEASICLPEGAAAGALDTTKDRGAAGQGRWPGWPGDNVFRLMVAVQQVGSIIGRRGEYVKRICEETRARVKIVDAIPGVEDRVVLISGREEPESPLPPAVHALLQVHQHVAQGGEGVKEGEEEREKEGGGRGERENQTARMLLPGTQAGSLIGRQGAVIKGIQDDSKARIRILNPDDIPPCALEDDRVVEVSGSYSAVHSALRLVALHLRKFLVDHSVLPLFEIQRPVPPPPSSSSPRFPSGPRQYYPENQRQEPRDRYPYDQQQQQQQGYPPSAPSPFWRQQQQQDYPLEQRGSSYPQYIPPQQQPGRGDVVAQTSYLPPQAGQLSSGAPPLQRPSASSLPHQDPLGQQRALLSKFGPDAATAGAATGGGAANSPMAPIMPVVTQVSATMQIPLSYVDAIIGPSGANIVYLRRSSGATITVNESRGEMGGDGPEMTVEVRGNASQVQAAQQIIENFMNAYHDSMATGSEAPTVSDAPASSLGSYPDSAAYGGGGSATVSDAGAAYGQGASGGYGRTSGAGGGGGSYGAAEPDYSRGGGGGGGVGGYTGSSQEERGSRGGGAYSQGGGYY